MAILAIFSSLIGLSHNPSEQRMLQQPKSL
jgi:hypothetical protein